MESLEIDGTALGSDWEAIPFAEEGRDSLELLPGTSVTPRDPGRALNAESRLYGVDSLENDATLSGSDWEANQSAE